MTAPTRLWDKATLALLAPLTLLFAIFDVGAQPAPKIPPALTAKPWQPHPEIYCDHSSLANTLKSPPAPYRQGRAPWPEDHVLGLDMTPPKGTPAQGVLKRFDSLARENPAYGPLLHQEKSWFAMNQLLGGKKGWKAMGLKKVMEETPSAQHALTAVLVWSPKSADLDLHVVEPSGFHFSAAAKDTDKSLSAILLADQQGQAVEVFTAPVLTQGPYRFFVRCQKGCSETRPVMAELRIKRIPEKSPFLQTFSTHLSLPQVGATETIWQYRHVSPGKAWPNRGHFAAVQTQWPFWQKSGQWEKALAELMSLGPQPSCPTEVKRLEMMAAAYIGLKEEQRAAHFRRLAAHLEAAVAPASGGDAPPKE